MLSNLDELQTRLSTENFQECYNDAVFYRDELRELFHHGQATLRERAGGKYFSRSGTQDSRHAAWVAAGTPELQDLEEQLSDIYYGNFSLFQSLPDIWAIDQLFPIMPIHRLEEKPSGPRYWPTSPVTAMARSTAFPHPMANATFCHCTVLNPGEEYYLGCSWGRLPAVPDLHNLLATPMSLMWRSIPTAASSLRGNSTATALPTY